MIWGTALPGFVAGAVIATVTAPVGVSGAVFLLPVQLSVLGVPSPAVTPTNLLFNVVSGPGALTRYWRAGQVTGPLTRDLLRGTLPGVVVGAVIRVFAIPDPTVFRLIVAALLLPLGLWLSTRPTRAPGPRARASSTTGRSTGEVVAAPAEMTSRRAVRWLALAVGVVGGIYGIGGGSFLGPILVGRGWPVREVAPAALASTFLTSIVGATTYALLSLTRPGEIAPDWAIGLACGAGGLIGGYVGARLQPHVPQTALRILLGVLALTVAALYIAQAVTAHH